MNRNDTTLAWVDIGPVDAIPLRGARRVLTPRGPVAVVRTHDGTVYAISDSCPHRGGPLAEGIVHGHSVTCPLHNWVLDLRTGEAQGADQGCVATFEVRRDGDRISVLLPCAARGRAA